jgi:hypothetical protein
MHSPTKFLRGPDSGTKESQEQMYWNWCKVIYLIQCNLQSSQAEIKNYIPTFHLLQSAQRDGDIDLQYLGRYLASLGEGRKGGKYTGEVRRENAT